ncbi:hypothetical protein ACKP2L_07145 [Oenococcus alcoholitolerans]|uniref:Uncharacterized protein n=1 Tax=Oenococcus alcoholitolerans TaxID=931074 RepID=A0ABR4XTI9_9LACO|nr:hypothetical protein Q757_01105 [Oenococcus alcoholitolerans]
MAINASEQSSVHMLLKFVDNQYLDSFINEGKLHFASLSDFRELENCTGDTFIGDRAEGSVEQDLDLKKILYPYRLLSHTWKMILQSVKFA